METNRFDRLTRSQRECLRLYHQRYRLKAIAEMMDGISPNTVGSYLTEAVAVLDAPGRPAAATMLAEWEAAHPESRGRFSVGDPALFPPAELLPTVIPVPPEKSWQAYLPVRTRRGSPNDLNPVLRASWIVALAIALAIGFGELLTGAHVLTDLASRLRRH